MRNRHSVEQIIRILGEIERTGLNISDACRPHGISERTYYRWRNKYGGMEISEARRLKELETENGRLKKLVADQTLDIQILKEVNSKKNGKPHAEESGRGDGHLHGAVQTSPGLPDPRAESVYGLLPPIVLATKTGQRGVGRSRLTASGPALATRRWLPLCATNTARWSTASGWRGSEGNAGSWLREAMAARRRRLRPGLALRRSASRPNEVWSYDFIQDSTADGGNVRILSIIDEYTRECLLLKAARSFPARCVIDALEEVMVCSGRKPQHVRSDNGPEFVAKSVQGWLLQAQVGPRYIEPGAPWENAYVESFHAQVPLELLDRELFFNLREVNAATSHYAYE